MSLTQTCGTVLDGIYKLHTPDGRLPYEVFHELPPTQLTHYYSVMRRPMCLTQIRKNLRKGTYVHVGDFVRDVAQVVQNAKAYNDPSTVYWQDADAVEKYVKSQYPKLRAIDPDCRWPVIENVLKLETGKDDDFSEPETGLTRSRRRRTARHRSVSESAEASPPPSTGLKRLADDNDDEMEGRKKRGRPPTVDRPHEHRIKAILRAVRRVKDETGRILSSAFEKVPDSRLEPTYHQVIKRPLAIDSVRKTIKRRGYHTVDEFLNDMNLILSNAKTYINDESNQVYKDAEILLQVMNATADEEKRKPDSAYADPASNSKVARFPLDSVEHRGETYRVGDWVHISNPNDPAKPTVGQIFRLWREQGKTWANCCWYYRPEQTVHKYDKLFWENEVVKSGQYRDHLVDDILEKCFVMFITKYQRGRPKDIGNRSVYLCESRYNEGEKTFNKIRTWKACIPDEIRNRDYPMEPFDKVRPLRRLYSPLRNELPANAKETDPIPEPTMGDPMAPPLKGAVYKRPYNPLDPPEEPTPPSPPSNPQRSNLPPVPQQSTARPDTVPVNVAAMPVFRGTGTSQQPTFVPTAYLLPDQFTNRLDAGGLSGVAKLPDGQPLWFPSCPISVTHRVYAEPLPPSLRFDLDGETKRGESHAHGFGHSARYLAWKRAKRVQV